MKFLTVKETASLLRLHEVTIYLFCKKRVFPSVKVGGQWRIPTDIVERLYEKEEKMVTPHQQLQHECFYSAATHKCYICGKEKT